MDAFKAQQYISIQIEKKEHINAARQKIQGRRVRGRPLFYMNLATSGNSILVHLVHYTINSVFNFVHFNFLIVTIWRQFPWKST